MERVLTVVALLSLALILMILQSLRRSHIRVEYSVSWLGAAILVYILSQWTWALDRICELLGIQYPPAALASVAMGVFLLVLYRISMILSDLKDNNIALAQKVAILEYELRQMQREPDARS